METSDLRGSVERFASDMEKKLRANNHKGGWEHESYTYLLTRLRQEFEELTDALKDEPTAALPFEQYLNGMAECVDVANLAMMIHDNLHRQFWKHYGQVVGCGRTVTTKKAWAEDD